MSGIDNLTHHKIPAILGQKITKFQSFLVKKSQNSKRGDYMENILCNLLESFRDYDDDLWELEKQLLELDDDIRFAERGQDWEYADELRASYDELYKELETLRTKQQAEYQKEISELPQPTDKTNFKYFDITKTAPHGDEYYIPGHKDRDLALQRDFYQDSYIAEMTPEEYLLLCGKYAWEDRPTDTDVIYQRMPEKENVEKYIEMFKDGQKAPMPVINVAKSTQEGRHRAFAAMKLGITEMPVLIIV